MSYSLTQVAKHVSDPGNQHNNGPYQDQICDAPNKLFMKEVGLSSLSHFIFFKFTVYGLQALIIMTQQSVTCLFVFLSTLRPK